MPQRTVRDTDGLTPQEAKFCALLAQGYTQADAVREAYNLRKAKPDTVYEKGSRLFRKPEVKARVSSLLREAKILDLISIGEWAAKVKEDYESARAAGNWTAASQFARLLGQSLGVLSQKIIVNTTDTLSDEKLIDSLAQGDEMKAAMLREMIGQDSFD